MRVQERVGQGADAVQAGVSLPLTVAALLTVLSEMRRATDNEVGVWLEQPNRRNMAQVAGQFARTCEALAGLAEQIEPHVQRAHGDAWAESFAEAARDLKRSETVLDDLVEHLATEAGR